jgi:hypothetical protein
LPGGKRRGYGLFAVGRALLFQSQNGPTGGVSDRNRGGSGNGLTPPSDARADCPPLGRAARDGGCPQDRATGPFKAALFLNNRPVVQDGDVPFYMALCPSEAEFKSESTDMRTRSQTETKHIFWASQLADKVDHHLVEYFRSKQIIAAKERTARTRDEMALVSDEKKRQNRHSDELRRLIRESLLNGTIWFRGNDRSPGDDDTDVAAVAEATLGLVLPEVFDRYEEGAARVTKQDLDSILSASNLHGLTSVYAKLNLLRDESGQTILRSDSGPLPEVQARIENRASYGETATGRFLSEEFAKEPFGWDFDVVRLFVACLLRGGKIDATSQGKVAESAVSVEARALFGNNNTFKSATFRPKVGPDHPPTILGSCELGNHNDQHSNRQWSHNADRITRLPRILSSIAVIS